jgi:hypothetical protein
MRLKFDPEILIFISPYGQSGDRILMRICSALLWPSGIASFASRTVSRIKDRYVQFRALSTQLQKYRYRYVGNGEVNAPRLVPGH